MSKRIKEEDRCIKTTVDIKVALKKWCEKQENFTTDEATQQILKKKTENIYLNNNRIAQFLRSVETHEYNKSLKRWVKLP
jgi:hypothetical protein